MQQWEREYYIARIVAGKIPISVNGINFYLGSPTRIQKLQAAQIYRKNLIEAEFDGAYTNQQMLNTLIQQGVWSLPMAEELDKLKKLIEDFKVGLYENRLKGNAKLSIRTILNKTRVEVQRLETIRQCRDHLTIDGLAHLAKYRYLIGCSVLCENGTPYWPSYSLNSEDDLIDKVLESFHEERIVEKDYRELARNEPWRSIWGSRNHTGKGLFDLASADLTDEQQSIVIWSGIYDNIREYPDAPSESVMDDDDMLDGWMILQKRKRDVKLAADEGDKVGNEKIRKADEQFIFVDSVEDARTIERMNDPMSAMVKSQRLSHLKRQGTVREESMPDQKMRISMELNKLEQMKMRQG